MIYMEDGNGLIPGGLKRCSRERQNPPETFQKGFITIEEGSGLIPNKPILVQNPAGQVCVGKTSKLGLDRPCLSFPIENTCISTSVRMNNPDHVCTYCYGKQVGIRLNMPTAIKSRKENYRIYREENETFWKQLQGWILYNEVKTNFFRYFVVGDIPDEHFLFNANEIAEMFPKIPFWIPTLKTGFLKRFLEKEEHELASNLIIRLSSPLVNEIDPIRFEWKSMTYTGKQPKGSYRCPSSDQDDECRDCWACWNKKVKLIAYPLNLQERKGKPKVKRSEYI